MDAAPIGICHTDLTAKFTYVNKRFEKVSGYSREEVVGKSGFKLGMFSSQTLELLRERIKNRLAGRPLRVLEMQFKCKDGHWIWVAMEGQLIREQGIPVGFQIIASDMTERKLAEETLLESEKRFRHVSHITSDVAYSCLTNQDGVYSIDWISGATERVTGYTIDEIKAQSCWSFLVVDEDLPLFEKHVIGLSQGQSASCELHIRHKNGGIVWITSYTECVSELKTPGCSRLYGGLVNITERKRAEEQLRESERKYSTLVERGNDGIIIIQDGLIRFANSKLVEVAGFSLDEVLGKPFLDFVSPGYKAMVVDAYTKRMAGAKPPNNYEMEILTRDGERIPVEINASEIEYEGKPADMAIVRDITERKRAEELFGTLAKNSPVGIYVVQDGKFCYVNPSFQSFTGYREDELLGRDSLELVIAEDRKMVRENAVQMLKGKLSSLYRCRVVSKGGEIRWVMESVSSIQYHGRRATLGNYMDITEHRRLEEALELQKAYFEQLFDNSPDAIVMLDTGDRVVDINKGFEMLFGYSNQEIKGRLINELIIPQDRTEEASALSRAALNGEAVRKETVRRRKDGSLVDVSALGYPIRFGDRLVGVYVIYSDITARKQAEAELKRHTADLQTSKLRLTEAQALAHLGSWEFDPVRDVVSGSEEFYRLFGVTPEKLANYQAFIGLLHPDDRSRVRHDVEEALNRNKPYDTEYRVVLDSGESRDIQARSEVSIDESGRPVRMIGTCLDITERRKMEEQIERAAKEWRTTFDSITDLVSIIDNDFKLVRVNRAFADTFGKRPKELIGKPCYEVVHKSNEPMANCPYQKTLQTKKPATAEFFEPTLGIYLEATTAPIFNEKGEIIACVQVARDVTQRKRMQEQLMLTDRLASIGELASGVAHELNNPLTSVIGFSQLLMERDIADDMKEDLNLVNSEAQRAASVVKNLLTFARKHAPVKQLSQVNNIIEDVLRLRAYEQKVNNIEVERRFAPNLPEIMVDYFQMQQVFLNIIINAEYFMTQAHKMGTLTITTERLDNIVKISFADDGLGIPKENLSKIFNPFFTTKEVGKGTGLGLSICHGIVTEHGGQIYARSQLGKGATFVVELPINAH